MKFYKYKRVSDNEVKNWLKTIPELTAYQKECIRDNEIVSNAPFEFYKEKEKINNIFVRLSIIPLFVVWIGLFILLPFNFILTGKWGYWRIEWLMDWSNAVGF